MDIKNTFDFILLTIVFVPFGLGVGIIGSLYYIRKGYKEGIVFSKKELLSEAPNMSAVQKVFAGVFLMLLTIWFFFIQGEFFRYLDGVEKFLN